MSFEKEKKKKKPTNVKEEQSTDYKLNFWSNSKQTSVLETAKDAPGTIQVRLACGKVFQLQNSLHRGSNSALLWEQDLFLLIFRRKLTFHGTAREIRTDHL